MDRQKLAVNKSKFNYFQPSIPLPDGLGGGGHVVGDVLLLGPGHQGRFAAPALEQ